MFTATLGYSRRHVFIPTRSRTADDLLALTPSTLNLDVAFLTPRTVTAAHALGLRVAVWTVASAVIRRFE